MKINQYILDCQILIFSKCYKQQTHVVVMLMNRWWSGKALENNSVRKQAMWLPKELQCKDFEMVSLKNSVVFKDYFKFSVKSMQKATKHGSRKTSQGPDSVALVRNDGGLHWEGSGKKDGKWLGNAQIVKLLSQVCQCLSFQM